MEKNHNHHIQENEVQYKMSFRKDTEIVQKGKKVRLFFRPELVNQPNAVVPLTLLHEKIIHLIILSKDLNYFSHKHPEYYGNGEYVIEHIFPSGGHYILFQDYLPENASQQLGRQEIHVEGDEISKGLIESISTEWKENGYGVKINLNDQAIGTHNDIMLKVKISKDNKPITDLDKYLGSLAHVVIISKDAKDYLHAHPEESKTNGPEIMLHANFPRSGYYKTFLEFKHEGQVRIATFVLAAVNK